MEYQQLIEEAMKARNFSYAPYSHYQVGAALLTKDGTVYTGCNIENAAFGPTNCAERTAMFKAISEGKREFSSIAIVGSPEGELTQYAWPCGVCRQVMAEFCDPLEFHIIVAKSAQEYQVRSLGELMPEIFGTEQIRQ